MISSADDFSAHIHRGASTRPRCSIHGLACLCPYMSTPMRGPHDPITAVGETRLVDFGGR